MRYRELIKKVQDYSGLSFEEAKEALQVMVEVLAVHLTERERKDFASQLPEELQNIALAVLATEENSTKPILPQIMELQQVDENRAKHQIKAAWRALKNAISRGEIEDIKAQLPNDFVAIAG